jgi:putative transcriptional regulator
MAEVLVDATASGLKERMAGEVVFSVQPGRTLRKWRENFAISQTQLAKKLKIGPQVIADYEADRRSNPGSHFIRRYLDGLVRIDLERGGTVLKRMGSVPRADGILGMREFSVSVPLVLLAETIRAKPVSNVDINRDLHGYTVIDAPRAILSMGAHEFVQIYGWTTQRVLIFSGMKYGRSAMVAIRAHPLKPAAVVYSNPGKMDPLAIRLSEVENIPLLSSPIGPEEMMKRLEDL